MNQAIAPGTVVMRSDGVAGSVISEIGTGTGAAQLLLEFADGVRLVVPPDLLTPVEDGIYQVEMALGKDAAAARAGQMVIPVLEEVLEIEKEQILKRKVLVTTRVEEVAETIDLQHVSEEIAVERVPINRLLDEDEEMPQAHEEDGVLIIPLAEEVQVVVTRLLLREEVRISKQHTITSASETVILRREVADIEQVEPDGTRQSLQVPQSAEPHSSKGESQS